MHSCGLLVRGFGLLAGETVQAGSSLRSFPSVYLHFLPVFADRLQHFVFSNGFKEKPNVSLAFSSFCAVYPLNPSPLLVFFIFNLFFLLLHLQFLYLYCLCIVFFPFHLFSLLYFLSFLTSLHLSLLFSLTTLYLGLSSFSTYSLLFLSFFFSCFSFRAACLFLQDGALHP